jgi:cysteine desulfurase
MRQIYLDHNANAPLDPAILSFLQNELETLQEGNPSSIHLQGKKNQQKLDNYRKDIARFFNVLPREIIFTSGGTEGATLLLYGFLQNKPFTHVISSHLEHSCIYQTLQYYEQSGVKISFLSADKWGAVHPEQVRQAIQPHTSLITLMAVNNETGVITDIKAIADIALQANIPFIVDGVAWLGKEQVSIPKGVSAIFFSGHKIGTPAGIGFCICRQTLKISPLFLGGPQEYGRRAGTENLLGICALHKAIQLVEEKQDEYSSHMRFIRDLFEKELIKNLGNIQINGSGPRVSNTSNLAFLGVDGETLLMYLDREGLAVSHGSACSSGALEPSRVLLQMGVPLPEARSSIRFSFGRYTSEAEIRSAIKSIIKVVHKLRS